MSNEPAHTDPRPFRTFDPSPYMLKLKGKDYLPVAPRIAWFRSEFPEGTIETEHVMIDPDPSTGYAVFKATITCIIDKEVVGYATSYGSEVPADFHDFIEKAETKAVGRALAGLGYGTLMAPELDEGERIVDAPQGRGSDYATSNVPTPMPNPNLPPRQQSGPRQETGEAATDKQRKKVKFDLDRAAVPLAQKVAVLTKFAGHDDIDRLTKSQASNIIDFLANPDWSQIPS